MLRDLVLVACILGCLGLTLRQPFAGVLTWVWMTLMQPNREAYGPVSGALRLNLVIALVTIAAWLASKERKLPPSDGTVIAIFIFLIWMTFNQLFAVDPDSSWPLWDRNWRIMALGLLICAMANNKVRIHALIWVTVVSFVYYGAKSGILVILAGGAKKLTGPSGGMYGDNNQFAVALLMTLPLISYLRAYSANRNVRIGLSGAFVLSLIAIIGSYSRGALVALGVLSLVWWIRSPHKIRYVLMGAVVAIPAFLFMPQAYYDRVSTIQNAEQDNSFEGRVAAWKVAFMYASEHFPVGAGFDGPQQPKIFHQYYPFELARAAHSIFFQILGDTGFLGLAIYLVILVLIFRNCSRIRKVARSNPEMHWAMDLATAIQLSMVAFCVGGSALSLAYCDLTFMWAGLLPPLWGLVSEAQWKGKTNLAMGRRPLPIAPAAGPYIPAPARTGAFTAGGIASTSR